MKSLLASWLLGREAAVSWDRWEHPGGASSRISPLPLTIRPKSSAKVTPLLSRCSCEPVLLPLSELRRMMPAETDQP